MEETFQKQKQKSRGNWDNQCDFFLSCLGYAVGLGNIWRFPYLCYKHGGGAFLIAYAIMLALVGLPLFFLELALGQYGGLGPNRLFPKLAPAFRGLGYAMLIVTFIVTIYYNMIMAWTLHYMVAGFTSALPWQDCGNAFNTLTCYKKSMADECNFVGNNTGLITYWNNTCSRVKDICEHYNTTHLPNQRDLFNFTMCSNMTHAHRLDEIYQRTSPSEDYFERIILGLNENIFWSQFGNLRWQMVLSLFSAWVIVCLCLIKGVQSSGKVVYFTATFPYIVLCILLGKGLTLPGSRQGIVFYIHPTWNTLLEIDVWSDAATQIFYSLGPAFGGLITLSSYSKFNNKCHRDAVLIALANCSTSIFAGFVIFSIIGFMAHEQGVSVGEVISSGPGLAFIAYPEAVTHMPIAPLWSFLFFFMLITLGLDSQFTMAETLITAMLDEWPSLRSMKHKVVIVSCLFGFLLGLPMCFQGGIYLFTLMDWYAASWSILLLAFLELFLIAYVYGVKRFLKNIEEMDIFLTICSKTYWFLNWTVMTPLILLFITITAWVQYTPCRYKDYVFPLQVQILGWIIAIVPLLVFFVMGSFEFYRRKYCLRTKVTLKEMFHPVSSWRADLCKNNEGEDIKEPEFYSNRAFCMDFHRSNSYDVSTHL